jgi:hypothetical protein
VDVERKYHPSAISLMNSRDLEDLMSSIASAGLKAIEAMLSDR